MSSLLRRELLRRSMLLGAFWPYMTSAQTPLNPYRRAALPGGKMPNRPYTPSPDDFGWLLEDVWPPLYFGAEIVDEARRKIAGGEAARALFQTLRAEAELAMKTPPQLPRERAGWRHDFYGRSSGGPLLFEPEQSESFLDPLTNKRESSTAMHRAWVLLAHERTLRIMRSLALLWQLGGEEKYAAWAAQGLETLAGHFETIGPENAEAVAKGANAGAVYFQPLYDAGVLLVTANVLSLLKNSAALNEVLRARWKNIFEERMTFLGRFLNGKGAHNMGCFAAAAIGLAGELYEKPEWIERALNGKNGFADQLTQGVPLVDNQCDGFWVEGTLFYHFYSLTTLITLRELARRRDINFAPDILRRFEAMFDAPLQLADAQKRLPPLSDFGAPRHFSLGLYRHLYEYAAGRLDGAKYGPHLRAIYDQIKAPRTDLAMLAYGPANLPAAPQIAPRHTLLPVSNIGIFRAGNPDFYLLFRAGKYVGGHDHPDRLGIFLHAHGELISPDLGEPGYALRGQTGDYHRTTLAHNTLFANEQDQKGAASLIWQPEKNRARGEIKANGITFRRTVFFAPPLIILLDEYQSEAPQRFNWIYHAYGALQAEEVPPRGATQTFNLLLPPLPEKEEWAQFTKRQSFVSQQNLRAVWQVKDGLQLRLHSASSLPFEATSGRTIGQPFPDDQGALFYRTNGTQWRVATVLEVAAGAPQVTGVSLLPNGAALDITGVRREVRWD